MSGTNASRTDQGSVWLPSSPSPADWLFAHADRTPDAPAVDTSTTRSTYTQLAARVRALAGRLAAAGLGPGDRVLVALPNTPATVVAGLALHAIGATICEVSREWGADLLADVVARTRCRHLFIWSRDAATWGATLTAAAIDQVWVVAAGPAAKRVGDGLIDLPVTSVLYDGSLDADPGTVPWQPRPEPDPGHVALVLHTSGSTGRPHGVIQTFGNIDANSRSIVDYLELGPSDRAMLTLPLSYCYGRSVLQTHLLVGGSVFLDHRTAFPRTILETIAAEGCTGFAGVPLTFEVIRRQVDVPTIEFPRLRYLTQAGGAMSADTIDWVRGSFAPAELFVMYGQTEATARLSYLPPDRAAEKRGSIGIAIPGVELRVVDEDGHETPPGIVGEIIARGANVTPGYLDEPAETAEILRDGWLWTGDLAERDADGFLYHRGRVRDILKVAGHRVSPIEIENVLMRHHEVQEAVVFGAPDPLRGEVPIAVVVPRPPGVLDEGGLLQLCRQNLAAYQVPARIVIVDSLPRNAAGKPLRQEVARLYGSR